MAVSAKAMQAAITTRSQSGTADVSMVFSIAVSQQQNGKEDATLPAPTSHHNTTELPAVTQVCQDPSPAGAGEDDISHQDRNTGITELPSRNKEYSRIFRNQHGQKRAAKKDTYLQTTNPAPRVASTFQHQPPTKPTKKAHQKPTTSCRFLIVPSDQWPSEYDQLRALETAHPKLRVNISQSSKGEVIITPRNVSHENWLKIRKRLAGKETSIQVFDGTRKSVVMKVPLLVSTDRFLEHPLIEKARRCKVSYRNGEGEPTQQVEIVHKGPPLEKLDLGIFGIFQVRPYVTKCYRCQDVGHLAKSCRAPYRCAICAENHDTRTCTQKTERARQTFKCSTSAGRHSVGSPKCPPRPNVLHSDTPKEACTQIPEEPTRPSARPKELPAPQLRDSNRKPQRRNNAEMLPVDSYEKPEREDTWAEPLVRDSYGKPEREDTWAEPLVRDSYGKPEREDTWAEPLVRDSYGKPEREDTWAEQHLQHDQSLKYDQTPQYCSQATAFKNGNVALFWRTVPDIADLGMEIASLVTGTDLSGLKSSIRPIARVATEIGLELYSRRK